MNPDWGTFGAHAMMLPFLEQNQVAAAANFDWTVWYGLGNRINLTVWNLKVASFLCPSDPNAGKDHFNSYHGSFGTGTDPWATQTNGIYAPRFTAYGVQDIVDGTSNTIAYVEALTGDFRRLNRPYRMMASGVGQPAGWSMFDARSNMPLVLQQATQCLQTMVTTPGTNSNRGSRWQTGSPGLTLTNIILPPNSKQFPFSACRWDCSAGCGTDFGHLFVPSSIHPGGVNVMFADGSVRFVKDTVNINVWMSLGSRDGGEVVSSDQY